MVFTGFCIAQFIIYVESPFSTISQIDIVAYLIYFYLVTGFSIVNNYIHVKSEITSFNNSNLKSTSNLKVADFVGKLLPLHIKNVSALQSEDILGDKNENVTLLFADIVGFTSYSSGKQTY